MTDLKSFRQTSGGANWGSDELPRATTIQRLRRFLPYGVELIQSNNMRRFICLITALALAIQASGIAFASDVAESVTFEYDAAGQLTDTYNQNNEHDGWAESGWRGCEGERVCSDP